MGTFFDRYVVVDFYVGRGAQAEWIGSVRAAREPEEMLRTPSGRALLRSVYERAYRRRVNVLFNKWPEHDQWSATYPNQVGWPWPYTSSHHSDWIITFDPGIGAVFVTVGGGVGWYRVDPEEPTLPGQECRRNLAAPDDGARGTTHDPAAASPVPLPQHRARTIPEPRELDEVIGQIDRDTDALWFTMFAQLADRHGCFHAEEELTALRRQITSDQPPRVHIWLKRYLRERS